MGLLFSSRFADTFKKHLNPNINKIASVHSMAFNDTWKCSSFLFATKSEKNTCCWIYILLRYVQVSTGCRKTADIIDFSLWQNFKMIRFISCDNHLETVKCADSTLIRQFITFDRNKYVYSPSDGISFWVVSFPYQKYRTKQLRQ